MSKSTIREHIKVPIKHRYNKLLPERLQVLSLSHRFQLQTALCTFYPPNFFRQYGLKRLEALEMMLKLLKERALKVIEEDFKLIDFCLLYTSDAADE